MPRKPIALPQAHAEAEEVARLRASLAIAEQRMDDERRRRHAVEEKLEARSAEAAAADLARADAVVRASDAEARARMAERRSAHLLDKSLPATGPYRLRLGVIELDPGTGQPPTSQRTFTINWHGTLYSLWQSNVRGIRHDPRLETILETDDRELAERVLSRRFVEVAPPAMEPVPVLAG